ncbi:phosphoribosylpyrophosphate synthetase [Clostridium omnivorum]|uniref:ribose-phosphate diphosphokinase n=2 Tax=Clostridium omnivorum TaxID=1604902 RepID=A0ABQ5N9G6_9CLOT|nr:phosphoribosylpyrophosphate synthetase [Clostridium sp. E14]
MSTNLKSSMPYGQLGIIALESCKELGEKIDHYLLEKRGENSEGPDTYLISIDEIRFSNGEGKVKLEETVRGKDIYILCDVGNYSCTYEMYGFTNHKGPDEHFQDIKRVVSALGGKARRVTVLMPMLYEGRQHKRKGRESLDCALALQELERLGVKDIYTFDVHDPNVQNAIPLVTFENLYPTYEIVKSFIRQEDIEIDKSKMLTISPDTGAMDRAIYYSNVLGLDIGLFYKRRDYTSVVKGKNPIVQHEYIGKDVEGMDVLIVDDMIASGESVFDIARELKKRNAKRIFVATTFALFTEGVNKFSEFYKEGLIDRVYSTNLTYISPEAREAEWFREVDMSEFISTVLDYINKGRSISPLVDATYNIKQLLSGAEILR